MTIYDSDKHVTIDRLQWCDIVGYHGDMSCYGIPNNRDPR